MNPHASDSPSGDGEDRQSGDPAVNREQGVSAAAPIHQHPASHGASGTPDVPPQVDDNAVSAEPITAKLVDDIDESPLRVGSPFAVDPLEHHEDVPIEQIYDVGPLRYTAMGAVAAAVLVLFFASIGVWWFPAGGAMIAALGCMLSIFGLYSTFRYTAAGLLAVHLCLFVFSYGRSLG
ncbi:MAG: hypothetical protein ACR2NZ_01725 [Rubripirellula sp.]